MRTSAPASKFETGALVSNCGECHDATSSGRPNPNHCGKLGHKNKKCWEKHRPGISMLIKNEQSKIPRTKCYRGWQETNVSDSLVPWKRTLILPPLILEGSPTLRLLSTLRFKFKCVRIVFLYHLQSSRITSLTFSPFSLHPS